MEPPQAYCCAISKVFSDTLFEMAPNISNIEQTLWTMSEKSPKKKKKTGYHQRETVYVHGASWKRHRVAKLSMVL